MFQHQPPKHHLADNYDEQQLEQMHEEYFQARSVQDKEALCLKYDIPAKHDLYNLMAWYAGCKD
jgi:predicted GNAT superfamily acetyltransferase